MRSFRHPIKKMAWHARTMCPHASQCGAPESSDKDSTQDKRTSGATSRSGSPPTTPRPSPTSYYPTRPSSPTTLCERPSFAGSRVRVRCRRMALCRMPPALSQLDASFWKPRRHRGLTPLATSRADACRRRMRLPSSASTRRSRSRRLRLSFGPLWSMSGACL